MKPSYGEDSDDDSKGLDIAKAYKKLQEEDEMDKKLYKEHTKRRKAVS